jgi:hypothetical protein
MEMIGADRAEDLSREAAATRPAAARPVAASEHSRVE